MYREKPNAKQLKSLMGAHSLKAPDIAKMLNKSESTVYSWLTDSNVRDVPNDTLRLVKILCASGKVST